MRRKRSSSFCLLLWICLLMASLTAFFRIQPVRGGTVNGSFTLYPVMDTFVNSAIPDLQVMYANEQIQIGKGTTGYITIGWLKFNLSQASIGVGAINITQAIFYLYAETKDWGTGLGLNALKSIDPSNETWTDTTITYNNMPTRYTPDEASWVAVNAVGQYYSWSLYPTGDPTYGLQAFQDAYDNNRTKSYAVNSTESVFSIQWTSMEGSSTKPRLEVSYTQDQDLPTEDLPIIENPEFLILKYYAIADSELRSDYPLMNYGSEPTGQISYSAQSGITRDHIFKFNISYPDLVDGAVNTNFSLVNYTWSLVYVSFGQYCEYSPSSVSESADWRSYNTITGISRETEDWSEYIVTWNNKPDYREDIRSFYVDHLGWYVTELTTDYAWIRYSVTNGTSYSVVNRVDKTKDSYGWNNWKLRESGIDPQSLYYRPNLEIKIAIGGYVAPVVPYLTFSNAHVYFANSLHVTPFIAGHLLSCMIYMATLVPIAFLSRKNDYFDWILTIGSMCLFVAFLSFGWLNIGVFAILFLITILIEGSELKNELF